MICFVCLQTKHCCRVPGAWRGCLLYQGRPSLHVTLGELPGWGLCHSLLFCRHQEVIPLPPDKVQDRKFTIADMALSPLLMRHVTYTPLVPQDMLVDMLRKTRQWFIRCILPQLPHKLPGALPSPDPALVEDQELGPVNYIDIDVPLVRDQLKRAEMIKATRIYKQGMG